MEGIAHMCHGSGQQAFLLVQQPLQPKALELRCLITIKIINSQKEYVYSGLRGKTQFDN